MATIQTQRINFRHDSDNPARITGYCDLVLIPSLDQFPLFYQCISLQKLNRPVVLMGRKKWDQFKLLEKEKHRMDFLFRYNWTYETGKLPARYEEKMQVILAMLD
jgi:hypothetical protein